MDVPFAIQSYKSDSLPLSAQRCINGYAEAQPRGAKSPVAVFGHPGIPTFGTCGAGPIRGLFQMNGVAYAVSGSQFYSFDSAGNPTLLGTGITGHNVVSIDGNGTQIVIANGTAGFLYNTTTLAFAQIADGDFEPGQTVTYLDGYFIFDWSDLDRFILSGLLDGTAYDAFDWASAEAAPDRILAVRSHQSNLLLMGEETIEYWNHTGALSFPFQRFDGAVVDRGILAAQAHAAEDNALFFTGNDRISYRLDGIRPTRVSTHAIEKEWETYTTVSDAFMFPVGYGGHKFIYTTFPTAGKTWGLRYRDRPVARAHVVGRDRRRSQVAHQLQHQGVQQGPGRRRQLGQDRIPRSGHLHRVWRPGPVHPDFAADRQPRPHGLHAQVRGRHGDRRWQRHRAGQRPAGDARLVGRWRGHVWRPAALARDGQGRRSHHPPAVGRARQLLLAHHAPAGHRPG
jgi:hypothetical protein